MSTQRGPNEQRRHDIFMERLRNFRLLDDEFMSKVFENSECANVLLQTVLQRSDLTTQFVESQRSFKNLKGHSIRLDIYATDQKGLAYDVEIQRAEKGADAKRARYYSSLIDADILDPGDDYQNLRETFVVFITENDVLHHGLPIYHIDRVIQETGAKFNDRSHIIYVNAQITDETTALGRLMHDFRCTNYEDMYHPVLANEVRHYKTEEEGVRTMSKAMEEICDQFLEEDREETAIALIKAGDHDYVKIANCTKLTVDRVKMLAAAAIQ